MASYSKAIQSSFYDFPIFYRIEKRQKDTLVLSYRDPDKIIFEFGPRRIDSPQVTDSQSFVKALPTSIIVEFFERLLWTGQDMRWKLPKKLQDPKNRSKYLDECLERRRSLKLPLAALFAADTWILFQDPELHKGPDMIEDDLRAIKRLIAHLHQVFMMTPLEDSYPAFLENRGIVYLSISKERLQQGGIINLDLITTEKGDSIHLRTASTIQGLGKFRVKSRVIEGSYPISQYTGINCEYENWMVHNRIAGNLP